MKIGIIYLLSIAQTRMLDHRMSKHRALHATSVALLKSLLLYYDSMSMFMFQVYSISILCMYSNYTECWSRNTVVS